MSDTLTSIRLRAVHSPELYMHWQREAVPGQWLDPCRFVSRGGVEVAIAASGEFTVRTQQDGDGWTRVQVFANPDSPPRIRVSAADEAEPSGGGDELVSALLGIHPNQWASSGPRTPDVRLALNPENLRTGFPEGEEYGEIREWVRQRTRALLGDPEDAESPEEWLAPVERLRDVILARLPQATAVTLQYAIHWQLLRGCEPQTLIDCSFRFTGDERSLYRRALRGDFEEIFHAGDELVRLHPALLTMDPPEIGLHLPVMDRRSPDILLDAKGGVREDGTIVIDVPARKKARGAPTGQWEAARRLATAAAIEDGASVAPSHASSVRLDAALLGIVLRPLVQTYMLARNVSAGVPGWPVEVGYSMRLNPGTLRAWRQFPAVSDPRVFRMWARVSKALQRAMRQWIPLLYFRELEQFRGRTAQPLLVYRCTKPFTPKDGEFTWDVLDDRHMDLICASARARLFEQCWQIHRALTAAGSANASQYDDRKAPRVLEWVRNERRTLGSLLVAERAIMEAFIKFGRRLASGGDRMRAVSDLGTALTRQLRRLYNGEDFSELAPLLLIEATAALAGAEPQVRLRLDYGGELTYDCNWAWDRAA